MTLKILAIIFIYVVIFFYLAYKLQPFSAAPGISMPLLSEKRYGCLNLAMLFLSVYLHLLLAILSPIGDTSYIAHIFRDLSDNRFFGFYQRFGITYPPLFNYFVLALAKLFSLLSIPFDSNSLIFVFSIKLPGALFELLMAWILYKTANAYLHPNVCSVILYLILLNPGYLFITSYICQVDAWYAFFMLLTLYLLSERHLKLSYFSFAVSILLKFQSVFITPVLIYATLENVFWHTFSLKKLFTHLAAGTAAIACMAASYLPFVYDFQKNTWTPGGILANFFSSVESYGKASQNAYNFWTLVGFNQVPISQKLGPCSCSAWSTIFIILLVLASFLLYLRNRHTPGMYPMLGAFLVSGTFTFAVKMMSRYLYPALVFLFFACAKKSTKKRMLCCILFSVDFFLVTSFDYMVYPWYDYTKELLPPYLISFYTVFCFFFLFYVICRESKPTEDCGSIFYSREQRAK